MYLNTVSLAANLFIHLNVFFHYEKFIRNVHAHKIDCIYVKGAHISSVMENTWPPQAFILSKILALLKQIETISVGKEINLTLVKMGF